MIGSDPVQLGLAASDNRPGGNATGVSILTGLSETKRLGLLRELAPQAASIGVLINPSNAALAPGITKDVEQAAQVMKLPLHLLWAATEGEIDAAFETIGRQRVSALLVASDPFSSAHDKKIVALAARHAVPAIYQFREWAEVGGLASYGIRLSDAYHQVGVYAGTHTQGRCAGRSTVRAARPF